MGLLGLHYNGFAMELNSESPGSGGTKPISEEEPMLYCPVCSRRLAERKCKLLCEQCGYYMSCADYC
jgi:Zn finger protein HypA/HybF involved in hydrogenase expression